MPKGGGGADKIQSSVETIDKLRTELKIEISNLAILRYKIAVAVESLEDRKLREIIEFRYIDGLGFEDIAEKLNYSWRHTLRLHGEALFNMTI